MDDRLQGLVRELKAERCPKSVMERVSRRRAGAGAASPWQGWSGGLRWAGAAVVVAVVLVGAWSMRHLGSPAEMASNPVRTDPSAEHALVLAQAEGALVGIGRVLIDAGARAGDAFRDEALPPLVNSFLTTKTKLTQY